VTGARLVARDDSLDLAVVGMEAEEAGQRGVRAGACVPSPGAGAAPFAPPSRASGIRLSDIGGIGGGKELNWAETDSSASTVVEQVGVAPDQVPPAQPRNVAPRSGSAMSSMDVPGT
jgi:hypothetical protein